MSGRDDSRRVPGAAAHAIQVTRDGLSGRAATRRIGDAEVKVGTVRPQPLLKLPCRSNMLKQTGGRSRGGHPSRSL